MVVFFRTGGVRDGGCGQSVRVPLVGNLSDLHGAAGHSAHAVWLLA